MNAIVRSTTHLACLVALFFVAGCGSDSTTTAAPTTPDASTTDGGGGGAGATGDASVDGSSGKAGQAGGGGQAGAGGSAGKGGSGGSAGQAGGGGTAGQAGAGGSAGQAGAGGTAGQAGSGGCGAKAGEAMWSTTAGSATNTPQGRGIAAGPDGEAYTVGVFRGSLPIGPAPALVSGSATQDDIYFAKFDQAGVPVWSVAYTTSKPLSVDGVIARANGDVFMIGNYTAPFSIKAPKSSDKVDLPNASPLLQSGFVAKLTSDGVPVWGKQLGGPSTTYNITALAADSTGAAIVGGHIDDPSSQGVADAAIWKFKPDGSLDWVKSFIGDMLYTQRTTSLAADSAGNIWMAGTFDYVIMPPNPSPGVSSKSGRYDAYLARFTADGNCVDLKSFGDPGTQVQTAESLAINSAGFVTVCGSFRGPVSFNEGATTLSPAGAGFALYLARFSPNGTPDDSIRFGDSSTELNCKAAYDSSENLYVSGNFIGTMNFGGSDLASTGKESSFVVKFAPDGTHQWSEVFNAQETTPPADQRGLMAHGMAVNSAECGPVYLTGWAGGAFNFGDKSWTSVGPSDIFLAALAP